MLILLFQFFLLLYWRNHNKILYWEPCFLLGGGHNKEASVINTTKNRKKIGENSSIEAFFAVQVSHKPEKVLKLTHANNQKKIGQKIWGCLRRQATTCLRRQPPPPPPQKKKNKPHFFLQKNATLNLLFQFFCFYIDVIIIKFSIESPASFWGGHNKETSVINTTKNRKRKLAKILQSKLFSPFKSATSLKKCSNQRTQTTRKKSAKKIGVASKDKLQPVFGDNPPPPPPQKKKINPIFFAKKCYVKAFISIFSAFILTLS